MAFPDGWALRCPLDLAQADATLADWTYVATENSLPAQIFSEALSNGGDIRFSSDQNGTVQLPCHIREFDSGGTADIAVKIPSLSGSSTTRIYVWWLATGETQPPVGDPFGQYASYDSNYLYVLPMTQDVSGGGNMVDVTSNQVEFIPTNILAPVSGQVGSCIRTEATRYMAAAAGQVYNPATWEVLFNFDNVAADFQVLSQANWFGLHTYSSELRPLLTWNQASGLPLTSSQWYHCAVQHEVAGDTPFLDGVAGNQVLSSVSSAPFNMHIATQWDSPGDRIPAGFMDEVRCSNIIRPAAWIKANSDNMLSQGTFTTVGTPESVIGGVDTTVTATNAAGSDVETFKWTEIPPP